jgi:putative DNA primase/helicase
VSSESIVKTLGGRKVGSGFIACCPAHDDRTPSLSIKITTEGKLLVHCHAGCGQQQVIEALKKRRLWEEQWPRSVGLGGTRSRRVAHRGNDDAQRTEAAMRIWQAAVPAEGTPVETYLRSRGIRTALPSTIRFHAALKHPSGGAWPALIALITRGSDDTPLGIHRTYLSQDGNSKAAIEPVKMMLGPCRGGAVRLAQDINTLMIGEGIETCLSVMQVTGLPAWAASSTSGMRALDLPDERRDVMILADGDYPGEAAAAERKKDVAFVSPDRHLGSISTVC